MAASSFFFSPRSHPTGRALQITPAVCLPVVFGQNITEHNPVPSPPARSKIFTRYSPVTSQTGRRSPSQRNAARVNATVQPAKHGSGRASRRWFLLTGAILSARAHFSNSSLADARRRLCGAASNSAIAGPLLASLSKRRVASVFRLRLLGEARATRSVLHVSRCWTLNEMGRLSTRCGDADGGSRRLRLAPTGTGACK